MRVLITGGAGFIGSRLARSLLSDHEVTIFDNFLPQVHEGNEHPKGWLDGVNTIRGDIRDLNAITETVNNTKPDLIYHLAAETGTGQSYDEPVRYSGVNVMGTANLIEAVRETDSVGRIVLAGSRSVYGEGACVAADGTPRPAVERTSENLSNGKFQPLDYDGNELQPVKTNATCPVAPASIYASSKLMQEYLLKQGFWGTDVEIGILRLQNVYGPGQSMNNPYTGVISIFCRQIDDGKTLNIFEDGDITRDFVLVDDVVEAFKAIGLADKCPKEIIDIGSGEATTILDMAKMLLTKKGHDPDKITVTGDFRAGDIRYAVADISAAATQLNWSPQFGFEQGVDAFLNQ